MNTFHFSQIQHREQLERLEETIQSKEEELSELLPNYIRLKTEEDECSARWEIDS